MSMVADVRHNGRTTERVAGPNDDLEAVFAESKRKAVERDGIALVIGGRTFEVWPSRFSQREKMRIHERAGLTVEAAVSNIDTAPLEATATLVLASMVQTGGTYPDIDGIAAWLRQVLEEGDDEIEWKVLSFDEAVEADPLERSDIS